MPPISSARRVAAMFIPEKACLGKTHWTGHASRFAGVNVYLHCRLAGLVAIRLAERQHQEPSLFGLPSMEALGAVVALHDVGKVCPGFQNKILASIGVGIPGWDPNLFESNHAVVSQCTLESAGMSTLARVAGRHHGKLASVASRSGDAQVFGGGPWYAERLKLMSRLRRSFGVSDDRDISLVGITPAQEWMLSGLVCVADWIASGDSFNLDEQRRTTCPGILRRLVRLITV